MAGITRAEVNRVFLWMYATPVLTSWSIASFLPVFGLFKAGATALEKTGDVVFLATGFVALAGLWAVLSLSARPEAKDAVNGVLRGRVGPLTAYATLWISLYWAFKAFVV